MRSGSLAAVAAAVLALAGCASQAASPSPTVAAGSASDRQSAISTVTGSTSPGAPNASASSSTPHSHATSPSHKPSASGSVPAGGMDPLTACVQGRSDTTPVPGSSLPSATDQDVQCLVDPLEATKAGEPALARFSRMADPSTASRGLRSWILSPYTPDLVSFDQTGYGIHGDTGPYMLVAIATPKRVDGVSAKYPDFVDGILRAAGATDLYSPATTGEHASGYGLVITCGHETLHGRTVCAWMGSTPGGGHFPFIGTLVILSVVPTDQAETVAENVLFSLTS